MAQDAPLLLPSTRSTPAERWIVLGLLLLNAVPVFAAGERLLALATGDPAPDNARFAAAPVPAILHVVGATAFCLVGAFQFAPSLRRRPFHRVVGRALAPLGIVGALSGMWMTMTYPRAYHDGPTLTFLRLGVGAAMTGFIVLGIQAIRRRDVDAHGAWMTRAYALGVAAGTQALTHVPYFFVDALKNEVGRVLAMASGWAINAAVAEYVIARRASRTSRDRMGPTPPMRAVVFDRYGGPEVLRIDAVPRPSPRPGQVLVRVAFASINAADYRLMRADPFLVRLSLGLIRPRRRILGLDVAGVVEAVGAGVTAVAPGDLVLGDTFVDGLGGFAEHVCVSERALVRVPDGVSLDVAAALPLAAVTALSALARARLAPGASIQVYGAGGGVGTTLVQIAKARGLRVTAVCGEASAALVRTLGADRVLDYTTREHEADDEHYDAVFGVNGYRSLTGHRARLARGGTYVMVGGTSAQIFEALLLGKARFALDDRRIEVLTLGDAPRTTELEEARDLLARGALRPVIDRVFALSDAAEAIRYVERGHVRGKVVLDART
jgi:NADPH:quinone reductase-like Zn-dependent oxidoreductase